MAGVNSSETNIKYPFGGLPRELAYGLRQREIGPALRYLGFGPQEGSPQAARFASRLEGATGPLADVFRSFREAAPQALDASRQIGAETAKRGRAAYNTLDDQIGGFLSNLPNFQRTAAEATDIARRGATAAESFAAEARGRLPGFRTTADEATGLASGAARRAFSPIADEDLYRNASRRLLGDIRTGAAARGLESGGGTQQTETDALRSLVTDLRSRRFGEQQQALGGVQQALAGATGVEQTGANTVLPALVAMLTGGQNLGQGAQLETMLGQAGIPVAQAGVQAVGQLSQLLQQQYGIPLEVGQNLLNTIIGATTGQTVPLIGATGPIAAPSSKGVRAI